MGCVFDRIIGCQYKSFGLFYPRTALPATPSTSPAAPFWANNSIVRACVSNCRCWDSIIPSILSIRASFLSSFSFFADGPRGSTPSWYRIEYPSASKSYSTTPSCFISYSPIKSTLFPLPVKSQLKFISGNTSLNSNKNLSDGRFSLFSICFIVG